MSEKEEPGTRQIVFPSLTLQRSNVMPRQMGGASTTRLSTF